MKVDVAQESNFNRPRHGLQTFTTLGLFILSLVGLSMLHTQVTVFDFGDGGPDARFFPRLILGLLALISALRLWRQYAVPETALGDLRGWCRVAITVIAIAVVVAVMDRVGFLMSVSALGVLLAWLLGERRFLYTLVLPVVITVLVTAGARYILNLPLP